MKCGAAVSVLLFLLLSLVEVHSQTAPYVTFMGETLPDHSYVDLSLVGGSVSGDEVVCNTDLSTCCNGDAGPHRGDWYFPNGGRLPFPRNDPLVEIRQFQRVELSRDRSGSAPSGIYHCSIETRAVNSDNNTDLTTRETVYVGLYDSGGDQANNILHSDIIIIIVNYRQHAAIYYDFSLAIIIIIYVYSSKLLNMITSAQATTLSYYSSLLWCTGCKYNYKVSQIIQNLKGVEGGKCLLVILEECLLTILQYEDYLVCIPISFLLLFLLQPLLGPF